MIGVAAKQEKKKNPQSVKHLHRYGLKKREGAAVVHGMKVW